MVLALVLMVVFVFVLGFYAAQNSATHDVMLFNLTWRRVPEWLPVVLSAAVMFVLMLVYAGYAQIRHTLGRFTLRKHIDDKDAEISALRVQVERLRQELGSKSGEPPTSSPAPKTETAMEETTH
jgi:hypothetical protein